MVVVVVAGEGLVSGEIFYYENAEVMKEQYNDVSEWL